MLFLRVVKVLIMAWTWQWLRGREDSCTDCEHGKLVFAGHGVGMECAIGVRRGDRCKDWSRRG